MKIKHMLVVSLLFSIGCSHKHRGFNVEKITETDISTQLKNIYTDSDLPGFSVIVVDDKEVVFQDSYGYADLKAKIPYTVDTVHNIGSVSKTFIAFALMKANQLGHLNLDDPVNKHLGFEVVHPQFPDKEITLRHLAMHTSGISDSEEVYTKSYVLVDNSVKVDSQDLNEYLDIIRKNQLIDDSDLLERALSRDGQWYSIDNFTSNTPGSTYHYSNIGAALAAHVIERSVGMSYEKFTHNYIFNPLLMTQTGWDDQAYSMVNKASKYLPGGVKLPSYVLITRADGGLYTNATDFSKYMIEMLNGAKGDGSLLGNSYYKEMFTRKMIGKKSSGIFWGVNKHNQPNHSGGDPGIVSYTVIIPERNRGIFFMTNISADEDEKLFKSVRQVLNALTSHF